MSYPWLVSAPSRMSRTTRSPFSRLLTMLSIQRERQSLDQLDQAMLDDIGITRDQARREAVRPAWDAPERWRG